MQQQELIADIEARAKAIGVTITQLCEAVEVHPTTFSRWKVSEKNPSPVEASYRRLMAIQHELERLEEQKAAA